MIRKHIWHDGAWREVVRLPPRPRIHILTDSMAPTWHPATGQTLDSKSKFREITRALGYEELGSDAPLAPPPPAPVHGLKQDIAQAIEMIEQGYEPGPVARADPDTRFY